MTIESATYISQLNAALPADGDEIPEGDNQIRLVKSVLQSQFTSLGAAAVTVTAAQINDVTNKSLRAGDTYTGTHAFAGATAVTVPTATAGDSSTKAASTAFIQAAIAAVNAQTGLAPSTSAAASFSVGAGQYIAATNAGAVAVTWPSAPAVGTTCGTHFQNNRLDNTIDLGPNGFMGPNGVVVTGVMTCDQLQPVKGTWFGDYWRSA